MLAAFVSVVWLYQHYRNSQSCLTDTNNTEGDLAKAAHPISAESDSRWLGSGVSFYTSTCLLVASISSSNTMPGNSTFREDTPVPWVLSLVSVKQYHQPHMTLSSLLMVSCFISLNADPDYRV